LADKEYQKKYGIKTKVIKLNEIHCSPKDQKWLQEYQEIVIGSYSMSEQEWSEMMLFSIFSMLIHTMKVGYYILIYLHERIGLKYVDIIDMILNSNEDYIVELKKEIIEYVQQLLNGEGRGKIFKKYSNNYLEIEEILFLKITENINIFYNDIEKTIFPKLNKIFHEEFSQVILFQKILIPEYRNDSKQNQIKFNYEIANYFFSKVKIHDKYDKNITKKDNVLTIIQEGYVDRTDFTNKKVIWARKNGTMLYESNKSIKHKKSKSMKFDIKDYNNEKTFSISLFDETNKFEKFLSI